MSESNILHDPDDLTCPKCGSSTYVVPTEGWYCGNDACSLAKGNNRLTHDSGEDRAISEQQIADLEKLLLAKDEALRMYLGQVANDGRSHYAWGAVSLTPTSVRDKYVTAEELGACQRERDEAVKHRNRSEEAMLLAKKYERKADEQSGMLRIGAQRLATERDSLAARVKELEEALEKLRDKHVEVLAELERVKEELAERKELFEKCSDELGKEMLSANQRQERINELTRELSAALTDKLEADATVERMREELEYGRKALANYGAAWQPQSLSIPRPTALREHDLALAERAWKAVRWTDGFSFEESAIYLELTKGEGK